MSLRTTRYIIPFTTLALVVVLVQMALNTSMTSIAESRRMMSSSSSSSDTWIVTANHPNDNISTFNCDCQNACRGKSISTTTESMVSVEKVAHVRQRVVCQEGNLTRSSDLWRYLCHNSTLLQQLDTRILLQQDVPIVQIGAHYGFEHNDPMARGLAAFLQLLSPTDERSRFHWYFVEPSPTNFPILQANLQQHLDLCDMVGIRAGIVPDHEDHVNELTFYATRDTIDGNTGYDSLSGKTLPFWISQISSFHKPTVMKHANFFKSVGLRIKDYIVEVSVTAKSYSRLMGEIMEPLHSGKTLPDPPIFVMMDTEGLDCDIIMGIADNSPYWPQVLIFEHTHCRKAIEKQVRQKLTGLGYEVFRQKRRGQNTVAVRK